MILSNATEKKGMGDKKALVTCESDNEGNTENHCLADYNLPEIERFLKYFCSDAKEAFATAWLDLDSIEVIAGMGVLHRTLEQVKEDVVEMSGSGTLHVTLNETDHRGRRKKNVKACRVVCVDIDRVMTSDQLSLEIEEWSPSMVVESSPGKHHLYWRLDRACSLNHWRVLQLGLAFKLEGDLELGGIAKTIRVPGVSRRTKDGRMFMPRIVHFVESDRKTEDVTYRWHPEVLGWAEMAEAYRQKRLKKVNAGIKKVLTASNGDREAAVKKLALVIENRNTTVFGLLTECTAKSRDLLSYAEVEELGRSFNAALPTPLDDMELDKIIKQAELYGRDRWEQNQDNIETAEQKIQKVMAERNGNHSGVVEEIDEITGTVAATPTLDFEYDYSEPNLKLNRFTEKAIQVRVLQRFGSELVRLDNEVFAFNSYEKLWKVQKPASHPEVFEWVSECALDVIGDSEFVKVLCTDKDGHYNTEKQRSAENHFMRVSLHLSTARAVMMSPRIRRIERREFDAVDQLVFCGNGVADLVSGSLRDPVASDYLIVRTGVDWDLEAKCPKFRKFVAEVFSGNERPDEMVRFIQELFGYCLSGSVAEERIFCHFGSGANGKSKMLQALLMICGDYATIIDPDELSVKRGGFGKAFERFGHKIEHRRNAVVDDIDVETVWNESFVKNVTGPRIRVRGEHEQSRDRINRCKLHLGINVAPTPQAENYGILRRLCIIPYLRRFDHRPETNRGLSEMIEREAPGILQWAREGYLRMKERGGIEYPEETKDALEEYKENHFSVESALRTMYEAGDEEVSIEDVISDLQQYSDEARHLPTEAFNRVTIGRILSGMSRTERRRSAGNWKLRTQVYFLRRLFVRKTAETSII